MKKKEPYKIPNELRDIASLEELKFIYIEAEKALADTKKSEEYVTSRTVTILSFMVTILIGLIGIMCSQFSGKINLNCSLIILIAITIIYIYILIVYLHKNLQSQISYYGGAKPENLLTQAFLDNKPPQKRLLFIYEANLQDMQIAIDSNTIKKDNKWERYDYALKAFIFLPIILIVIFFLFQLFYRFSSLS